MEKELILRIRKRFRFGKILIEVRDGLPDRIEETIRYERLSVPEENIDEELSTV